VEENSNRLLGNGENINFWLDKWCGHHLASLMNIPNMFWRHLSAKVIVQQVIVPIADRTNKVFWIHINSSKLSFKEDYIFKS